MPRAQLSDAEIYYETTGSETGAPLVLIMGWGSQMVYWNPEFIAMLADAGFRVIHFDNRDVGMSENFRSKPGYDMVAMARDCADLIRHLGYERAHVLGQSMGGMIAQVLAVEFSDVVQSLNIFYSSPCMAAEQHAEVAEQFSNMDYFADSREEAIQLWLERESHTDTGTGTNGFEGRMREIAELHYDRGYFPDGMRRQFEAMGKMGDLRPRLGSIAVPTAVVHGADDVLLPATGGIEIATAIPHAELHIFADLGHEIARRLWPDFVRIAARSAQRSGATLTIDAGAASVGGA